MNVPRASSLASVLALVLLCSSGCGGNEKIVSVSGKVTHNGDPVPGLVISFVPVVATETGVSTGKTDDNGLYSLRVVKSGKSGAVVGSHKVWVSLPREFVDPTDKEERAKMRKQKMKVPSAAAKPPVDLADVLKKYGNLDKSPLTMEVKGGEPIDLKLD